MGSWLANEIQYSQMPLYGSDSASTSKSMYFDYSLHNVKPLENAQSAKYLGITIPEDMDWGQHVFEICSKSTDTLGFLRRNLDFAPTSIKEVTYKLWFDLNLSMQHPFGALTRNFRLIKLRNFEDGSLLDLQQMAKRK